MKKTTAELQAMTVAELESHLDEQRDHEPKPYLRSVMAVRNAKIEEEHCDHWCVTAEEYAKIKHDNSAHHRAARDLHAAELAIRKLEAKAELSVEETARLVALKSGLSGMLQASESARNDAEPLHTALSRARSRNIKAFRLAGKPNPAGTQTATVLPANVGVTGAPAN